MKYIRILWLAGIAGVILFTLFFESAASQQVKTSPPERVAETSPPPLERITGLYNSPELIPAPNSEITDESGRCYYIIKQEIEAVKKTGRKTNSGSEILYQAVEKTMEIPNTAEIQVTDEAGGMTVTAKLPLTGVSYENERWEPLLSFTVTFHQYGAGRYRFGVQDRQGEPELYLPDSCPEAEAGAILTDFSDDLLTLIGLSPEDGRIEGFRWTGGTYQDEAGTSCRDGEVWGSLKVYDCRAEYSGVIPLPDMDQYRLRTIYKAEELTASSMEEMEAPDAGFEKEVLEQPEPPPGFWKRLALAIKKYHKLTISLLLILLAALGARFLIRAARKLDRKWKD